jgi:MoaA/NifB/PqqE/SkfB family radical SAM enzyme
VELKDNRVVLKKIRKFNKYITEHEGVGVAPRGLILNYSNACNFKCEQCFTESPSRPITGKMSLETIKRLADEAHELGMYEILIEGGEPLVCSELYDIIRIFGADRFYMGMTTNGFLLTKDVAKKLKEAGMSRVSVSLDSTDPETHNRYRKVEGAYEHAIQALENAKEAGMQPSVNFLVGRYNIDSGEVEEICEFCKEKGYHLGLQVATPTGNWQGKFDVMITAKDAEKLERIREKYKNVWRDLWTPFPNKKVKTCGCIAVNRPYINPYGEVLPCSYLHMSLGNIHDKSLKDIIDYGFSFPCFRDHHKTCYTGEDVKFMKEYSLHKMSILDPIDISEIM